MLDWGTLARTQRNVIVSGMNEAVFNGDIAGRFGVDAIGITGRFGGHDLYAPGREAIALAHVHMRFRRVAQGDLIQGEVVRVGDDDQRKHTLKLIHHLGLVRQVPPCHVLAKECGASAAID